MKKLTAVLALLALVPAFSPASADALTLAQRVERLEGKLNCLRRVPVNEYADFAGYGDRPTDRMRLTATRRAPTRRPTRARSTTPTD